MPRNPFFFSVILFALVMSACQPDGPSEPPPNPFDAIIRPDPPMPLPEPDSASIVGIHKYILTASCAVPGCHDGSFEPDFRTVQSSYSTLVFHPVVKNDTAGSYQYRVVPFQKDQSWLYNRITTDDQTLGRMPLYDNPLKGSRLKAIEDWIDAGAPDMFGNVSTYPNTQARFTGVAAFQNFNGLEIRVDTFRNNDPFSPFGSKQGLDLTIWFAIDDDSTEIGEFQNSRAAFASGVDNVFNFQPTVTVNAQYSPQGKVVVDYYGPGEHETFYWSVTVSTNAFPINDFTLFRLYTNDGDHAEDFEFPRDEHPIEFKSYMAIFVVE